MLYSTHPSLVLGFHGCDEDIAEKVISGKAKLEKSTNNYDWLGHGTYFWENNPVRALEYAQELKVHPLKSKSKINQPAVIGAILDLGYCLDLLEARSLALLKDAYKALHSAAIKNGAKIPENKKDTQSGDLLLRYLDCSVIQAVHFINESSNGRPYDSVRGAFWEGEDLYPHAGFKEKNHIQICIRNPNCIKGYFRVLEHDDSYSIP